MFGFVQNAVAKKQEIGSKVTGDGLIAIANWHLFMTDEEGNDFLHTHAVEKGFIRTDYDELVPADDTEYVDDLRRDHVELIPAVVLWP